jgi:hypothetical protein
MSHMRVLERRRRLVVQLGRVGAQDQQRDCVLVELQCLASSREP